MDTLIVSIKRSKKGKPAKAALYVAQVLYVNCLKCGKPLTSDERRASGQCGCTEKVFDAGHQNNLFLLPKANSKRNEGLSARMDQIVEKAREGNTPKDDPFYLNGIQLTGHATKVG